jgi:hypothetical protein
VDLDQVAEHGGKVHPGAAVADGDVPPAPQRLADQEDIRNAPARVPFYLDYAAATWRLLGAYTLGR